MKAFPFLALLLVSMFAEPAGATAVDDAVQSQVHRFYHWYVHELNKKESSEPGKSPQIHRYVSERFLHELAAKAKKSGMDGGGLEYDPFIMAQDWDKGWENNIRVKDMDQAGAKWRVQVELSGKEMSPHRLNLVLVPEDGVWKIDKVSDGDTR